MRPAARLDGLGMSLIRAMSEGASEACVSLGLGEPSWSLPPEAQGPLDTLDFATMPLGYGPNSGSSELRAALGRHLGLGEDRFMACAGSQAALFAIFQAYTGPGDQVLVPDPGFLAYPTLARLSGAQPLPYTLGPDGGLDPDRFASALEAAPRTRLALINHPANPSGGGASAAALDAVARLCERRDILLVSDEVYRELYLDTRPAGLFDSGLWPGAVVLGSMSKAFAVPGLRLGWAIGSPETLAPARLVHNAMLSCLPRPAQAAAAALLPHAPACHAAGRDALAERWQAFEQACEAELGFQPKRPAGGFYYWLALPESAHNDPLSFCLRLRDIHKVIIIPGLAFGTEGRGYARLSWAAPPGTIRQALSRLAEGLKEE